VAFDEVGIVWEYETEGFDLPSGYYLPDFWLPYEDAFLEVKPTKIQIDDSRLLVDLARESGHTAGVLIGTPGYQFIPWVRFWKDQCNYGVALIRGNAFSWGESCHLTDMFDESFDPVKWLSLPVDEMAEWESSPIICNDRDFEPWIKAIEYSRSARFEHGERPR
jgi:hypothetical protein